MEIKTWSERAQAFPMSQRLDERTFMREEITDLRLEIERQAQEVLKLHRDLAAEKLRADQGWHRYEAANSRKNELEAERANWAQEIVALKASMPADENAQPVIMSEDDAEQLARSKWTVKQWYEHVGAWENAQGEVCFGSVMALGAMLKLMAKARNTIAPVAQKDAIGSSATPQRNLLIAFADILKDVASNEEVDEEWIADRFNFDLKWRHLTLKTGKLNCQDADDLAAAIDAARAKDQPQ